MSAAWLERFPMACAEAGHPGAECRFNPLTGDFEYAVGSVPADVAWKAAVVSGVPTRCRRCSAADRPMRECLAVGMAVDDCGWRSPGERSA